MPTFRRRSWKMRYTMSGLLPLQNIRALDVTEEDLGILRGRKWTRVRWDHIAEAKLVQKKQWPPIARYSRGRGTNRAPEEAIRLMEEHLQKKDRHQSGRRWLWIQTWEYLQWKANGKRYKINTTDFAPDFEDNGTLRELLINKMRPQKLHYTMWQRSSTWIGILLFMFLLWIVLFQQ